MLDENPALNSCLFQDAPEGRRSYSAREAKFGRCAPDRPYSRDDRAFLNRVAERHLSAADAMVYRATLDCANHSDGACFPSHQAVADRLAGSGRRRICSKTVARALKRAELVGLVSWVRRYRRVVRGGRVVRAVRSSNGYVFLRKPCADDYRPLPRRKSVASRLRALVKASASSSLSVLLGLRRWTMASVLLIARMRNGRCIVDALTLGEPIGEDFCD